jgi:hypothetical protein
VPRFVVFFPYTGQQFLRLGFARRRQAKPQKAGLADIDLAFPG